MSLVVSHLERRQFLRKIASCAGGMAGLRLAHMEAHPNVLNTTAVGKAMRITDIEIHEIFPPLHEYNTTALLRSLGTSHQARTIYIVKTSNGLEGYGETWELAPSKEKFSRYIGTSPFDWMADTHDLPMNMALYDLMGKELGLPVWKLFGPSVRTWIPLAAWTVSQPPEAMAQEVVNVSKRGYRWLKYHVSVLQNVIDQTAAMQKVAPVGFKVHYDFNADSTFEAVYPVLKELEKFPIAGRVEDPINISDHAGWRLLRQKCSIPMIFHHDPTPTEFFIHNDLCDGFVASRLPVGIVMKLASQAEATRTPFILQQPGGMLSQAFLAHEAATFKMASLEAITVSNLWKDDVTVETMPVIGGSVAVPTGPGLGVNIDREKLERYAKTARPKLGRFLARTRYKHGLTIFIRYDPDAPGSNERNHLGSDVPGPAPGYGNSLVTDFWDEVGSDDFEKMWRRTESGPVWTQDP